MYVTCEELCYTISVDQVNIIPELKSTQEEADKRLLLHAAHAARDGYKSVIVETEDTDVLCMLFQSKIACPLYQKCGTQTRTRYVDIRNVTHMFGEQFCEALPGLHTYTGCDTVSAFAGRGKVSALQKLEHEKSTQEVFSDLGKEWELSEKLFIKLQKFTCQH